MQVSRSGYYAWCRRPVSPRKKANEELTEQLKAIYQESDQTYGSPRVHSQLRKEGVVCSEKRIARLMRVAGLKACPPLRWVTTTDSNHAFPVAENTLDRLFSVATPNAKWSTDITYVWTSEGWLYLAVILDLFSRRVVGWAMGTTLERSLVLSALSMAQTQRKPSAGLLCHSDRGSQYASHDYQNQLRAAGIVCSMSRKGNCWDNAPTESFFASLKRELVHRRKFATRQEAKTAIFRWIEVWYNRKRQHSSLGYLSPEEFERQHQQQQQQRQKAA
jgi:putative transposase